MHRGDVVQIGLVAAALLAGCGGSEPTHEEGVPHVDAATDGQSVATPNDAAISVPFDTSMAEPLVDVITDAATETVVDARASDADAQCAAIENLASPIDETTSRDLEPTPSGGPIVDGTYVSTRAINYGNPDAGYHVMDFRETLLIANGIMRLVRDLTATTFPHVDAAATYRTSNNTLLLDYFCAPGPPGIETTQTSGYTSAMVDGGGVELTIYDHQKPEEVVVFSRIR
jgi:hypothetical protein